MRKGRDFLLKTLKRYFCSSQTHCKVLLLLLLLLLILFRYCTDTDSFSFLQMRHSSDRYSYKPTLQWNPQVEDYFIKAYGADHFSRISQSLTYVLLFLSRSSPTVFFFFFFSRFLGWLLLFLQWGCIWKRPWIPQNHGLFVRNLCCRSFLH